MYRQFKQSNLRSAVCRGDLETVRQLINSKGLPSSSYNVLLDAAQSEHSAITRLLLTNGAEVNCSDPKTKFKNTPLHYAVKNRWYEIVEMMISKYANIEAKNNHDQTPLCTAIRFEDPDMVELLLQRGANANGINYYGEHNLLIQAIEKGNCLKIVEHLLNYGADVNASGFSSTPLNMAIENKDVKLFTLLLNKGAKINAIATDVDAPLHAAARCSSTHFIQELLNRGADIHALTSRGFTPLYIAVQNGNDEIVKILLSNGASINASTDNLSPLYVAVRRGCETTVKLFLEHFPDVKISKETFKVALLANGKNSQKIVETLLSYGTFIVDPEDGKNVELFHGAIKKERLKLVEELLKHGADVTSVNSSEDCSPLHSAAGNKSKEVTDLLINNGADINATDKKGKTPIYYAVKNGSLEVTKLLQIKEAVVQDRLELLINAVKNECVESVKILLQYPGDINAHDQYRRTALHFTSFTNKNELQELHYTENLNPDEILNLNDYKRGDIAKFLLSQGAYVDAQTKDGITTLHAASNYGLEKVVQILLEHNANVNVREKKTREQYALYNKDENRGKMPLHFAAEKGHKIICSMLLDKGAELNAKNCSGYTALHLATENGHSEIIHLLLEHGDSVDSKTDLGRKPLHFARSFQDVEIFLKRGADVNHKDKFGETALHSVFSVEVVEALLENGADINIANNNNCTPLGYVKERIESLNDCNNYDYDSDDGEYYTYDTGVGKYIAVRDIFELHILKMIEANLFVSERNISSLTVGFYNKANFQKECRNEIALMKNEAINGSNCLFYDIIVSDLNTLAKYVSNDDIVTGLQSPDLKVKFPLYACLLKSHFRKGIERKQLLEKGYGFFNFLYENSVISVELPSDCTEKIFSYLANNDLKILTNLFESLKNN